MDFFLQNHEMERNSRNWDLKQNHEIAGSQIVKSQNARIPCIALLMMEQLSKIIHQSALNWIWIKTLIGQSWVTWANLGLFLHFASSKITLTDLVKDSNSHGTIYSETSIFAVCRNLVREIWFEKYGWRKVVDQKKGGFIV